MNNSIKQLIEIYHQNRQAVLEWKEDQDIKRLFEYCGLILYDNKELIEKVKEISNDILVYINKPFGRFITDTYIIPTINNDVFRKTDVFKKTKVKFFSFDLDMMLIKRLFVCIAFDDTYNSFLDNSAIIGIDNDKIQVYDTNYKLAPIDNPNKSFVASLKCGNRYEYASIIINLKSLSITRKDIMEVILHEIQHIYDSFDYESYAAMNSDTMMVDKISVNDIYKKPIDDLMNDQTIDIDSLTNKIKSLHYDSISYFFNQYVIYHCNISEMRSRLINFKKDVDSIDDDTIRNYRRSNSLFNCQFFRKHSKIFNHYYLIFEILRILVELYPVKYKEIIAGFDIKELYDFKYNHPKIHGYAFNTSFSNNGLYDYIAFDNFCIYHINNIKIHFLKDAMKSLDNDKLFENLFYHFLKLNKMLVENR